MEAYLISSLCVSDNEIGSIVAAFVSEVVSSTRHKSSSLSFMEFVTQLADELIHFWDHSNRDALEFIAFGSSSIYVRLVDELRSQCKLPIEQDVYDAANSNRTIAQLLKPKQFEQFSFALRKLIAVIRLLMITFACSDLTEESISSWNKDGKRLLQVYILLSINSLLSSINLLLEIAQSLQTRYSIESSLSVVLPLYCRISYDDLADIEAIVSMIASSAIAPIIVDPIQLLSPCQHERILSLRENATPHQADANGKQGGISFQHVIEKYDLLPKLLKTSRYCFDELVPRSLLGMIHRQHGSNNDLVHNNSAKALCAAILSSSRALWLLQRRRNWADRSEDQCQTSSSSALVELVDAINLSPSKATSSTIVVPEKLATLVQQKQHEQQQQQQQPSATRRPLIEVMQSVDYAIADAQEEQTEEGENTLIPESRKGKSLPVESEEIILKDQHKAFFLAITRVVDSVKQEIGSSPPELYVLAVYGIARYLQRNASSLKLMAIPEADNSNESKRTIFLESSSLATIIALSLRLSDELNGNSSATAGQSASQKFAFLSKAVAAQAGFGSISMHLSESTTIMTVLLNFLRSVLSDCCTSSDVMPFATSLLPQLLSINRAYDDVALTSIAASRCLHCVIFATSLSTAIGSHYAHQAIDQVKSQLQLKPIESCVTILITTATFVQSCSPEILLLHVQSLVSVVLSLVNRWNLFLLLGSMDLLYRLLARLHWANLLDLVVGSNHGFLVLQIGTELIRIHTFIQNSAARASLTCSYPKLEKELIDVIEEHLRCLIVLIKVADAVTWKELLDEFVQSDDSSWEDIRKLY